MTYKRKKKHRIIFYISCLLIILIYLVFYIDSDRYHNFTKVRYSLSSVYSVTDFTNVLTTVKPDNMLKAKLEVSNDRAYLNLPNFKKVLLDESNHKILDTQNLHPTQSLALFSMGYLSDYFLKSYTAGALEKDKLKHIEDTYLFVYNEINNPFSLNLFVINDHAVSERVQFLALLLSYTEKNHPAKKELISALSKDFNLCCNLLRDRSFFTWRTNHGIMQLRSLGQVMGIIENVQIQKKLKEEFEVRLNDIVPYFIGEDGAIYESATGYWYYIYKQFLKIAEIPKIQNLPSVRKLDVKLKKAQLFLNCVASCDQYIEGIGDSYPFYLGLSDTLALKKNRVFQFSNNLVGANWCYENVNANVLFSSLHTPPNVHKQPDDLMFALYINSPFFSNTGTYSYDYSEERLYFKNNENAHNSVVIMDETLEKSDSSFTKLVDFDSVNLSAKFMGTKYYATGQTVSREIEIDPKNNGITISDSSTPINKIKTSYNVSPNTKVKKISEKEYLLINADSIKLALSSNQVINIKKTIISTQKEKIDTIQKLEIIGENILTKLAFDPPNEVLANFGVYNSGFSSKIRFDRSRILGKKYHKFQTKGKGLKYKLMVQFCFIAIVLIIFTGTFEYILKK